MRGVPVSPAESMILIESMLYCWSLTALCTTATPPSEHPNTRTLDTADDDRGDGAEAERTDTEAEPLAEGEPRPPSALGREQPPSPEQTPPTLDPTMLDAAEPAPTVPAPVNERAPVRTTAAGAAPSGHLSPEQLQSAVEAAYAELYRPAGNPVRLNVIARALFANVSGQDRASGRMGGITADVGPAWNRVGFALTLRGWSGRVAFAPQTVMTAMLGGGPTVGLGRLALLGRGYIDLRLGYDLHYARMQDGNATSTHGPRARLDLGLLLTGQRRYFHGVGASLGFQRLLGSLDGQLPGSNMLSVGVAYWMG